jgi:hypothetical protein
VPFASSDAFSDRHARALAANPTTGFSARFKDGQNAFRVGERIRVELLYSPGGLYRNRTRHERCIRVRFDKPVPAQRQIDTEGLFDGIPGGILGGVHGAMRRPQPLTTIDATLTNLYAFDEPGRYRLFVESKQRKDDVEISDILEFEILPRDAAWEASGSCRLDRPPPREPNTEYRIPSTEYRRSYSNRSASIGSVAAALVAGYQPKKMPIAAEKAKAVAAAYGDVIVGQPNIWFTPSATP